jgi:hypothetical protein
MTVVHEGTNDSLTLDAAQSVFASMLSAEAEEPKDRETPPAQEIPEPAQPDPDASPEPAQDEGKSEQPEESVQPPTEPPVTESIDPSTKVRTKVDGQEIEVTLEEALKGYSRTQDYTRKTQELAERRKAFETEDTAVRAERVQLAEYFKSLEQVIQDITPKEPNWDQLRLENPVEFAAQWAAWDQHQKEVKMVKDQRAQAEAQVAQDRVQQQQTHIETERQKLFEAIPEWKDEGVAKADRVKLVAYATKLGYSNDDLAQVEDHKALLMLRKAMLWDEAQEKKPEIRARIEKVKTATPGSAGVTRTPVSDTTRALERLAKTGKQEDAAAAYLKMLGG